MNQSAVSPPPDPAPVPSATGSTSAVLSRLLRILRGRFVAARELAAFQAAAPEDIAAALDELVTRGLVTAGQRVTIEELFREQQTAEAEALRERLVSNNLVSADQGRTALERFLGTAILGCTFPEYLVRTGLLTSAQAGLLRPARTWRVPEPVTRAVEAARSRPRTALAGAGAILVLLVLVGLLWPDPEFVEPDCFMNGLGAGSCTFTNARPGKADGDCGFVLARCGDSAVRKSVTFCGGALPAHGSSQVEFSVGGFDQITPDYGDWRESCHFVWISANSG